MTKKFAVTTFQSKDTILIAMSLIFKNWLHTKKSHCNFQGLSACIVYISRVPILVGNILSSPQVILHKITTNYIESNLNEKNLQLIV